MAEHPFDDPFDRSDASGQAGSPQEFAFADVGPDGVLHYVSPFGETRWGWRDGDRIRDELRLLLSDLAPGSSSELPLLQGGLRVNGIRRGEDEGWILVGYEDGPVPVDPPRDRLDPLVDRMPVAALRLQDDGTVVFVNRAMSRMTGYSEDEIAGTRFWDRVVVEDDAEAVGDAIARSSDPDGSRARFAYRRGDGSVHHVEMHLHLTEGYFVDAVVLDRPVDAYDALLLGAGSDDAAGPGESTAFLATLSHEIRTPIGAIRGYADLMARELDDLEAAGARVSPALREFTASIADRSDRLAGLVRDLLELSAIEAGHVTVESVPVHVRTVLDRAVPRVEAALREKRLTLTVSVPGDPLVMADARRLERIVDRLLSNAVKFTSEGSISIRVRRVDREVSIEVHDTGPGIPETFRRRMFAPFTQAEEWLNHGREGAGLGLALVKRAVDLLGGRIEVESRETGGSTFRVILPSAG